MLPRLDRRKIVSLLKKRKLEDFGVIDNIESCLREKRGYVFRMPQPGSSVILLLSGGLDSIVSWGILMKEYGLKVYPLFFNRERAYGKKGKKTIRYFSKYFKRLFPNHFIEPLMFSADVKKLIIPPERFHRDVRIDTIFEKFRGVDKPLEINTMFGLATSLPIYGRMYAEKLYYTKGVKIDTIFCAVIASDGFMIPHQTVTSLRSAMYYLCTTSGDFGWQFSSVALEPQLGIYLTKRDLIKWGHNQGLPMEKTWTCWYAKKYQCGNCITCRVRKNSFKKVRIEDKTVYKSAYEQSLKGYVRTNFGKTINRLLCFFAIKKMS